jgi:Trk K+ transport system NAD-binding subunit
VIGRSVSEIASEDRFPRSCVVAGMSLERKVEAPRGNSVFAPGMRILLVVAREDLSRAIDIFLEGGRLSRMSSQ